MIYKIVGVFVLFLISLSSAWSARDSGAAVPETQMVMIGTVSSGQTVKITGQTKFYRSVFSIQTKYFDFEGNRCQAVFREISEKKNLSLEEVNPRLRFLVGDQIVNLQELRRLKWEKSESGYVFEGKIKINSRLINSLPLYIHIPNSPQAQSLRLGYLGNSCAAPLVALPDNWDLSSYDYWDQDQQEYSLQLD